MGGARDADVHAAGLAEALPRAGQLLELIARQHDALAARDPEAIERNAAEMRSAVDALERLAPQLRLPPAPDQPGQQRLRELLDGCRARNAEVGARIDALARHTRHALTMLCGRDGGSAVYGRRGVQPALATSRYDTSA